MIPLRDAQGERFESVFLGLGWDPLNRRKWFGPRSAAIDLNAAALLFAGEQLLEAVYHENFLAAGGAIRLHGDNLDGTGAGDDEVITIDLIRLPEEVTAVGLIVTSYTGENFDRIDNIACHLGDTVSGIDIDRIALHPGEHTAVVVGLLLRDDHDWQFRRIAQPIPARHPAEAVGYLRPYLAGPPAG